MPTTTQRPPRARKPAVAPVHSPAAARLIELIQAEAREKLLNDLSSKDAITVLHGFDSQSKVVRLSGTDIRIHDGKGNRVDLYRRLTLPESWRDSHRLVRDWHPSKWYVDASLVDNQGANWNRDLGLFVCDDFGNLVEVAA